MVRDGPMQVAPAQAEAGPERLRRPWRLGVTVTALLVLAALGGVLRFRSASPELTRPTAAIEVLLEIRAHVDAGRNSLRQGNFQLAAEELNTAVRQRDQYPDLLARTERNQLTHLWRQAVLLGDLLSESLEEILRRLAGQQERERQAAFARRYAGAAVVFDAQVWRDASGHYHLDYRLFDGVVPARVEIQDLTLLQDLPLQNPQRLVFGARLAGIQREPAGKWIVRFDPESTVLFTDPDAIAASCAQPHDPDLLEVLRRQRDWLGERP
jgi:hypothetical protein